MKNKIFNLKSYYSYFIFLIMNLVLLSISWSEPINQLPEIKNAKLIRIGITSAPGNGHQSAAATIYSRLRGMGYKGEIEIIYPKMDIEQLSIVFPFFNSSAQNIQRVETEKLTFISSKEFASNPHNYPLADFGIMGADDHNKDSKYLNVKNFLKLQPFGWKISDSISTHFVESVDDEGKSKVQQLPHLADLKYQFDIPNYQDVSRLLMLPKNRGVGPNLKFILDQKNQFETAAVYAHFASEQAAVYSEAVVKALDKAHFNSPNGTNGFRVGAKPTIIFLVNSIGIDELQRIKSDLQNSNVLKDRSKMISAYDKDFQYQIGQAKPNEIVLVTLGPIPKAIFEYLFATTTLPNLVEGRNSMNLMETLGKAYLPSQVPEGYLFPNVPDVAQSAFMEIATRKSDLAFDAVMNFVLQAYQPQSALNHFFEKMKVSAREKQEKDKLFQGLILLNEQANHNSIKQCRSLFIN